MQGRFDEARVSYEAGHSVMDELDPRAAAGDPQTRAEIELLAGAPEAAERVLRSAYAVLERWGEQYLFSSVAGLLGEVLAIRARDDEAERYAEVARAAAKADDFFAQVLWRRAYAHLAVPRNEPAEADRFAREAVEIASATDDLNTRVWTLSTTSIPAGALRSLGLSNCYVDVTFQRRAEVPRKYVMGRKGHIN